MGPASLMGPARVKWAFIWFKSNKRRRPCYRACEWKGRKSDSSVNGRVRKRVKLEREGFYYLHWFRSLNIQREMSCAAEGVQKRRKL